MEVEQYIHHGKKVFVMKELKGKHREHCLCWQCDHFLPSSKKNCSIASKLFNICVTDGLVTPVYECPKFIKKGA